MGPGPGLCVLLVTLLWRSNREGACLCTFSLAWAFHASRDSRPAPKQQLLELPAPADVCRCRGPVQWKGEQVLPAGSWGSYLRARLCEVSQVAHPNDLSLPLQGKLGPRVPLRKGRREAAVRARGQGTGSDSGIWVNDS